MKSFLFTLMSGTSLLISSLSASAQSTEPNYIHPKQYLPSSPDVMAFNKISFIPVGLFTGKPNITVPITNLKIQDYDFPISINYNAGGIKVEEIASNVGLGWSLNAYGNISVAVNGFGDFQNNGFATLSSTEFKLPDAHLSGLISYQPDQFNGGTLYRLGVGSAEGTIDTQPDIYSYAVNGISGKFYFDQYGQAHTIPFNGVKIEHSGFGNNISITDLKGIKYTFGDFEFSELPSNCSASSISGQTMLLTTIALPTGSTIQFEYIAVNYTQRIQPPISRNIPLGTRSIGLDCTNTNTSMIVNSKAINRIISSDGTEIKFYYGANRTDLVGTKVLDRVEVKKMGISQNTNFYYSYFGSSSEEFQRLKLDSVKNYNGGTYSFTYNGQISLPSRYSFSQDHWGYYNGKNNPNLLPVEPEFGFTDGANREVDPSYLQANILTRVTYPTKGYTDFVYEPNDYYSKDTMSIVSHADHYLNSPSNQIINFTIPEGAIVSQSKLKIQVSGSSSGGGIGNEPEDPQDYVVSIQGNNGFQANYTAYQNQTLGLNLSPGVYSMQFSNTGNRMTNITLSYDVTTKQYSEGNRFAGGLRLKTQISYAKVGDITPLIESYVYAINGKSSGQINYKPKYTYLLEKYFLDENVYNFFPSRFFVQNSASVDPLNSLQGGSVGYTFVSKIQSSGAQKAQVDTEFSHYGDYGGRYSFPLPPVISMDWANGMLLKETSYIDKNGMLKPVKEVRNSYSIQNEDTFWDYHFSPITKPTDDGNRGIGYVIAFASPPYLNGLLKKEATFFINDYRLISKWIRQDSIVTTHFDTEDRKIKTISIFNYGDLYNLMPTRIKIEKSNGRTSSKRLYYTTSIPDNLKTTETAILKSQHRLSQIILSSDSINVGQNVNQRIIFKNFGNDRVYLNKVYLKNGSADEYPQLEISLYDTYGNAREFKDLSNSSIVYLWGYSGKFPAIEIKNATYAEVATALTQAAIDNLNSSSQTEATMETLIKNAADKLRTDIPKAMVTSYTYRPLVGMTSKTDARGIKETYTYDGMQRLQTILDHLNYVTKSFDYHYRPN
ncbi:hypothetical protein AAW12_07720 [Sphingobacterium sp. Ag1]|uniref:hypothetical protein n=1 Tax=Sphingobacterium sp. Ag1 TaxID=1643451 RepID=UPI00062782D7|nr:hypothetical protein [Sphingobacterium sp. Ag1]KKO92022.1 hypothetical protein AAW12_07720 [Sphingobacterium sp. Ag1]